ncbi:hypothetical protein V8F33_011178 [Rhypophila sp. PSN 637]
MDPTNSVIYGDRRRSVGRGGAGNIVSRSEAEALAEAADDVGQQRRRSSIWSASSSSSADGTNRGPKIFHNVKQMFRRKSGAKVTESPQDDS